MTYIIHSLPGCIYSALATALRAVLSLGRLTPPKRGVALRATPQFRRLTPHGYFLLNRRSPPGLQEVSLQDIISLSLSLSLSREREREREREW